MVLGFGEVYGRGSGLKIEGQSGFEASLRLRRRARLALRPVRRCGFRMGHRNDVLG